MASLAIPVRRPIKLGRRRAVPVHRCYRYHRQEHDHCGRRYGRVVHFFGLMAPPWYALDFTHEGGTAGHFEALLRINYTTLCSPFHLQNMQLISALSRA